MMRVGIPAPPPDPNASWMLGRQRMPDAQGQLEAMAAKVWIEQNRDRNGVNYGHGQAQDLMLGVQQFEKPVDFDPWLTERERRIMATLWQWLFTNCGRGLLHESYRRAGWVLSWRSPAPSPRHLVTPSPCHPTTR